ncbi:MAG: zinc ribbon domain-containing protein [Armatimonadota bacterium]|nr:MAG: zinc ribbon domain-containing protein [Armatimonadota bacterium]
MPIYEYRCPECGGGAEVMARAAEADAERECERCGAVMNRLPSAFAVAGRASASAGDNCCGLERPCNDPKRCCER